MLSPPSPPPLPETACSLIGRRLLKQDLQLVLSGGLLLLHELGVALGDAPSGGTGQGGAVGAARRRRELLPVVPPSPEGEEVNKCTLSGRPLEGLALVAACVGPHGPWGPPFNIYIQGILLRLSSKGT